MEGYGRLWKVMEGYGRLWNILILIIKYIHAFLSLSKLLVCLCAYIDAENLALTVEDINSS